MESSTYPHRTLFALRRPGSVGWEIDEVEGEATVVSARVLQSSTGSQLRVLGTSRGPTTSLGLSTVTASVRRGWVFDPRIDAWRAPDEASIIAGEPTAVDSVKVSVERVEYGWVRLSISEGNKSVALLANDMYDPIAGLKEWITFIRRGEAMRSTFDFDDRRPALLHAIPVPASQRTRFAITDDRLEPLFDIELPRQRLSDAFASFCHDLANHPHLGVHWVSWVGMNQEQDDALSAIEPKIEAELEARFPRDRNLSEEDWNRREELEARLIVQALPLTEEQENAVTRYRKELERVASDKD